MDQWFPFQAFYSSLVWQCDRERPLSMRVDHSHSMGKRSKELLEPTPLLTNGYENSRWNMHSSKQEFSCEKRGSFDPTDLSILGLDSLHTRVVTRPQSRLRPWDGLEEACQARKQAEWILACEAMEGAKNFQNLSHKKERKKKKSKMVHFCFSTRTGRILH